MNLPTTEEIQAARDEVDAEGPQSETTIGLAQLALTDPHLKAFVETLCTPLAEPGGSIGILLRSTVMGAVISGLNLGIRIGEAREDADPDRDPET